MKSLDFFRSGLFIILLAIIMGNQAVSENRPTEVSPGSIYFTENLGQFGEKTLFRGESGDVIFYLCRDEAAYLFVRDTGELMEDDLCVGHDDMPGLSEHPRYKKEGMLIRAQFVGANPDAEILGEHRLLQENNYFLGSDPTGWRTNVPNYSSVIYKEIYPGIDLRYYGNKAALKYDFIVRPGADLSQILIKYSGINELSISGAGDLEIETEFGVISEKAPYAYQDLNGVTQQIPAGYEIIGPDVFGFKINGDYDRSRPLVIDPQLIYSTYFGGSDNDEFSDIKVDSGGSFYAVGKTRSLDYPTLNPYQDTLGGHYDIVITKFDRGGQNLIFSTYLGGNYSDRGIRMALNETGNKIYILGSTESTDFPTVNPFQSYFSSEVDFVVVVMSADGDSLEYSSYLGGVGLEYFGSIDIDSIGNIYIAGGTPSPDFPVVNAMDPSFNGWEDIFLTRLNYIDPTYDVVFSTFLGGTNDERVMDVVVGNNGRIYIVGNTNSDDFPMVNSYDSTLAWPGFPDLLVAVVSGNGDSLVYSTYLGGSFTDRGNAIALDENNNIYVAGSTTSSDFPTTGGYSSYFNGNTSWAGDALVSIFSPGGDSLLYSTFFGGNDSDEAIDLAVGGSGVVYISGNTRSINFPAVNAFDYSWNGNDDAFVAALDITGGCCLFSTYMGGSWYDWGEQIEVAGDSLLYFCGIAESDDFPLLNPIDNTWDDKEGFVSIFDLSNLNVARGMITGTVYDEFNNSIQDVRITLLNYGFRDTTEAGGSFEFNNLCPGYYDISLTHYLFFDTVITDLLINAQGNTINIDIVMDSAWYPEGDNCFDPYVITDTTFPIVVSGNTAGFNSDYFMEFPYSANVCWQWNWSLLHGNGPDVVYIWTVPSTASYDFELCDQVTNFENTDLFLWRNTCPWEPEFPRDFICGAEAGGCYPYPFNRSARLIDLPLTQGEEILITIDGHGTDNYGDFELIISSDSVICDYTTGDANGDWAYNGLDITYGVNYFKGGSDPMCPYGSCPIPPCDAFYYCGDVNGSCSYNGLDITYGVNYFKGGPGPIPCGDCPPLSMSSALPGDNNNINNPGIRISDEKDFSIQDGKVKK